MYIISKLLVTLFLISNLSSPQVYGKEDDFSILKPPERSYKILMLLPFASKSHRNVFLPIANGLAERGHKVGYIIYYLIKEIGRILDSPCIYKNKSSNKQQFIRYYF